ncbi:DUF5682 family protein [Methylobacterium oryzihabitans]|uniref:Rhodanese domain-containing protein n=1 Tax=Methylobacterium oryzihabitans TaxID=2499852 RepID=A0A3S2YNC1_9HYPH|nr:DUF5682 family protein [Methylobacterium oryzihabitans]RVU15096.1 hypothetical protein EOE48_21105 [Methylobacterium oryzihabitans]
MSGSDTGALAVVGVRHHSPACARLVRRTIAALRPAFVLVEGPADYNPFLADLALDHALPVAIFSFRADDRGSSASYSPFCAFSPEWAALVAGREVGAGTLFCDLPAWDPAFGQRRNRYADPHGARAAVAERALAAALGAEDQDALWDALAEAAPEDELPARLDRYFALLRPPGTDDPAEAARERFMAAHAAWALREAGGRPVVLVCGGWHAEAIRRYAAQADGTRPAPAPAEEGTRTGSYVVPYSYARLDRFSGYGAGMPSPGYYERVAADGLGPAADWAAGAIAAALREAGQVVSTADRIAWAAHAGALARLRAHPAVLRADLIDGALACLVKDALDAAPAWAAGTGAPGHPALAAMLRALTGTREGRLAPGTRRPPLAADVEERLRAAGLEPGPTRRHIALDWAEAADRARAHLLHRLVILGLPGIAREEGPDLAEPGLPREGFSVLRHPHWPGALIEASQWGGTLEMAAGARLATRIEAEPDSLPVLAGALSQALFAGLPIDGDLLARLRAGLAAAHDPAALGAAGRRIVRLHRFGGAFGDAAGAALARLGLVLAERALVLIELVADPRAGLGTVDLLLACRDLFRDCPDLAGLGPLRAPFVAMLRRRLADPGAPPALAGAALGFLVACEAAAGADDAVRRLRRFGRPDSLGDFLAGLFALAREEIAGDATLAAVEDLVGAWDDDDFLRALPSLRMAFGWFPPRERERIAVAILRRSGAGEARAEAEALAWMRQRARPLDQAAALAHEARVAARLTRYGLT